MIPERLQELLKQRKIREQEKLIEVLRRPETHRRRPAAKLANIKGTK
jgi:hypothetical protein